MARVCAQGLLVHVGEHQHLAAVPVLHHAGHEAALVVGDELASGSATGVSMRAIVGRGQAGSRSRGRSPRRTPKSAFQRACRLRGRWQGRTALVTA